MTVLSEIKRMQAEGRTEEEIIGAMKQQGVSPREITEALSQSKIQEAVTGEAPAPAPAPAPRADTIPMMGEAQMPAQPAQPSQPMPADYAASPQYPPAQQMPATQPMPEAQPMPAAQGYQDYQQQYAPGPAISPDTITEISEQVVSEKLSPLRKDIEKVIDLKTTVESKVEYLDERLKRIEKIIDRLQLSITQKIGDYMTNVEDIKKEITETQKSFKALNAQSKSTKTKEEKQKKEKA